MLAEQRFLLDSRAASADAPGLVLDDDGYTYVVQPGGGRSRVGGGRPASRVLRFVPSTDNELADTHAVQAAVDALPSDGGEVVLDRGPYRLAEVVCPDPVRISGVGPSGPNIGPNKNHYYASGTRISCSSRTSSPFAVYADGCQFERLYLQNTAPSPPTDGAGILVAENGNSTEILHCSVVGFYVNIDVRDGAAIRIQDVMAVDPVLDAISLRNASHADSGGHFISGNWISAGPTNLAARAGIYWASGGGTKVENNRIGGEDVGMFAYGALFQLGGTGKATIAEFVGNTIEDLGTGIEVVSTSTGQFKKLMIVGNYIDTKSGPGGAGIVVGGTDATTQLLYGNIDGNVINANGAAMSITNVSRLRIGINEYATSKRGFDFFGTNTFLWMGPNMDGPTSAFPDAAMFRAGAYCYNTDLFKTLWTDGAGHWRDSAGTIVI